MEKITFNNIEFYKIKGFSNYYISKCGKVLSTHYHNGTDIRILKQSYRGGGYLCVCLHKHKKQYVKNVHRLVAETLIQNPNDKITINHKDGFKSNNKVDNIEWNTVSENRLHAYKTGLQKPPMIGKFGKNNPTSKSIFQIDKFTNKVIKVWDAMMDVQRELGINNSKICLVCQGKNKTAGGFKWEYFIGDTKCQ